MSNLNLNFLYPAYALVVGAGLYSTDYKGVQRGRPVAVLMFGVFLANALVAIAQMNLFMFSTLLASPGYGGTKLFLQTMYLVGDIGVAVCFESVYIYRMATMSDLAFNKAKWTNFFWVLLLIPLGYTASHLIAIARLYDKTLLTGFDFTQFHNEWHACLAIYNLISHFYLTWAIYLSFKALGPVQVRQHIVTTLYPVFSGILYAAFGIWGAYDTTAGVGGVWFAFSIDNLLFMSVNTMLVRSLLRSVENSRITDKAKSNGGAGSKSGPGNSVQSPEVSNLRHEFSAPQLAFEDEEEKQSPHSMV